MALNYIFIFFFLAAFVIALARLIFLGDVEVFPEMVKATFDMAKTGFEISLGLTGVLTLCRITSYNVCYTKLLRESS